MNKYKDLQQCLDEVIPETRLRVYSTPLPRTDEKQHLLFEGTPGSLSKVLSNYWLKLPCYIEHENQLHLSFYVIYGGYEGKE